MKFEGLRTFRRLFLRLAQADMVFYLLPPLMALLTAGTIAQKDLGLYEAQHRFFSSFILWAGPVPLPGGYALMALLTLSLSLKFLLHSTWSLRKAGVNLAHLGVLVLLLGGLLTALTAREGYMAIPEGEQSPYVYDYFDRALYVFHNDNLQYEIDFAALKEGQDISGLPFALTVKTLCGNCKILKRGENGEVFENPRGMAQFMALSPQPPEKDAEANLSGMTLEIGGAKPQQNGVYIAFDAMPKPIELGRPGATQNEWKIIFGKRQRLLPFQIKLIDFVKDSYPGTDMARGYSADVLVLDNGVEWPARISMNQPLRYKGYTFYQSSFERGEAGEVTILSVVENSGRLFPYLGAIIVAAGLLLHLLLMAREKKTP